MSEYDLVVVGAGVSGLSLAHYACKQGLRTRIIEQTDRAGGAIHTERFGGDAPDFWIELGAHTCYNSYAGLLGIVEDRGMIERLIPRQKVPYRMLLETGLRSIPSQIDFLELLISIPRVFFASRRGKSVAAYYSRILGRKNFDRVFRHLFNAVPSQRADDFPADILFKKRHRRKDILRSFTLAQGLQSITDAIAVAPNLEVLTGREVVKIESAAGLFTITTGDGGQYHAPRLALATPANAAAGLARSIHPELAAELGQIDVVHIETTGVVVDKADLDMQPVAGIVPAGDSFYSVVTRDTVPHDRYRGFTFHFKPGQLDQEQTNSRIADVLRVPYESLQRSANKRHVLPCFHAGHENRVKRIDALLEDKNILLTGNYFNGMSIEDCVLRSLREFNRVFGSLSGS